MSHLEHESEVELNDFQQECTEPDREEECFLVGENEIDDYCGKETEHEHCVEDFACSEYAVGLSPDFLSFVLFLLVVLEGLLYDFVNLV